MRSGVAMWGQPASSKNTSHQGALEGLMTNCNSTDSTILVEISNPVYSDVLHNHLCNRVVNFVKSCLHVLICDPY